MLQMLLERAHQAAGGARRQTARRHVLGIADQEEQPHRFHLAQADRPGRQKSAAGSSLAGFVGQLLTKPSPKVLVVAGHASSTISPLLLASVAYGCPMGDTPH